ncbi:hypothetical protein BRC2024_PQPTKSFJ_CDS_0266 [Tegunavirus sp. BRC001]
MRSLNNFKNTVPNFVKDQLGAIELVQIMEFPDHFLIMTFDALEEEYTVISVNKRENDDQDESELFNGYSEKITLGEYEEEVEDETIDLEVITSFEDYAVYRFALELGIEGI